MYLIHSLRVGHCCKVLLICLLHGEKHVALLEEDEPQLVQVGVALQPQLILPPGPTNSYLPDNSLFLNLGYTYLIMILRRKNGHCSGLGSRLIFFRLLDFFQAAPAPRFFFQAAPVPNFFQAAPAPAPRAQKNASPALYYLLSLVKYFFPNKLLI